MVGIFGKLFQFILILIFPFILLIRTSVYLHINEKLFPWVCILGGILFTTILIIVYLTIFYGRVLEQSRTKPELKQKALIAFLIVVVYCLHGLFYMSGHNFKSQEVRKEVAKIHPILRLSISTLIHLDEGIIITDTNRKPEDYKKMGLPSKKQSLHYVQSNGYSHAVDLRTNGHNEIRNFLVRIYFKLMGFNTLRHFGTADHLHVSLTSHDNPWAK